MINSIDLQLMFKLIIETEEIGKGSCKRKDTTVFKSTSFLELTEAFQVFKEEVGGMHTIYPEKANLTFQAFKNGGIVHTEKKSNYELF